MSRLFILCRASSSQTHWCLFSLKAANFFSSHHSMVFLGRCFGDNLLWLSWKIYRFIIIIFYCYLFLYVCVDGFFCIWVELICRLLVRMSFQIIFNPFCVLLSSKKLPKLDFCDKHLYNYSWRQWSSLTKFFAHIFPVLISYIPELLTAKLNSLWPLNYIWKKTFSFIW